jgi:hypothetical protein
MKEGAQAWKEKRAAKFTGDNPKDK